LHPNELNSAVASINFYKPTLHETNILINKQRYINYCQ